jgi:adenylate kinase family enzyme
MSTPIVSTARSSARPGATADQPALRAVPRPLRRVHILGAPGSGKSTLALRLAGSTDLPVHHLDDLARVGGGNGPLRLAAERDQLVAEIAAGDAWIVEGVHLGWTEPFLARAELIVWLDGVTATEAAGRIARRFVTGAWTTMRRRSWRERITAVPGYARHSLDLAGALYDAWRYRPPGGAAAHPERAMILGTQDATAAAVEAHLERVERCRTTPDVERAVARVLGDELDGDPAR